MGELAGVEGDPGVEAGGARCQRLGGEIRLVAVEILDEGADREAPPRGVAGELARRHAQEIEAEARADGEELAAELDGVELHRDRAAHDVDGGDQEVELGDALGERLRHRLPGPGGDPPLELRLLGLRHAGGDPLGKRRHARQIGHGDGGDIEGAGKPQEPRRGALHQPARGQQHLGLHLRRHLVVEEVHLAPERVEVVDPAHHGIGAGDVAGAAAGALLHVGDEGDAAAVHQLVGDAGGDDLAPEAMRLDLRPEALRQRGREIGHQILLEMGIVGQVGRHEIVRQRVLDVGHEHRLLRPRQAPALLLPGGERLVVGQELDGAVELRRLLHGVHEPHLGVEALRRLGLGQGQRQALEIIVRQHQARDVVGELAERLVALLHGEVAGADAGVEQDLDVDLVVRGVDAGGVVDGVGVDAAAGQGVLDAAALGHAEIGALAHDLARGSRARRRGPRRWRGRRRRPGSRSCALT